MTPANTSIPKARFRHARRLQAPKPARPNNAGKTKTYRGIPVSPRLTAETPGEGARVYICMTLLAGVHVSAPLALVVQLTGTFTGEKVQVVFTGKPLQDRLT